jgi:hypothetical protein
VYKGHTNAVSTPHVWKKGTVWEEYTNETRHVDVPCRNSHVDVDDDVIRPTETIYHMSILMVVWPPDPAKLVPI